MNLWNNTKVQPTQLPVGCGHELDHARPGDPAEPRWAAAGLAGPSVDRALGPRVALLPNKHWAPFGRVGSGFPSSQPNQTCFLSENVMNYPSIPTNGRIGASTTTADSWTVFYTLLGEARWRGVGGGGLL